MNYADTYILEYLFSDRAGNDSPGKRRLLTLLLAAHVFLYAVLRKVPRRSHLTRVLVSRLQTALSDVEVWRDHHPVLAWAAFAGMIGSAGREDKNGTFSEVFDVALDGIKQSGALPAGSKQELQPLLAAFLWDDKLCRPAMDAWRQTGQLQCERVLVRTRHATESFLIRNLLSCIYNPAHKNRNSQRQAEPHMFQLHFCLPSRLILLISKFFLWSRNSCTV